MCQVALVVSFRRGVGHRCLCVVSSTQDESYLRIQGHMHLENASWKTLTYPKSKSRLPAVIEIRRWECDGMVLVI